MKSFMDGFAFDMDDLLVTLTWKDYLKFLYTLFVIMMNTNMEY